ncbi:hypothetical protein FX988_00044 [Paraglaciecola mesophila]|uniref:Uncharacterized protein n=1 Tax=Paraglaciecola mesophila TaxID=197222 RepID=A0A857JDS9_9ALTE|nr:hypothetical protein [Paraglaciecola mesophila]QHJ09836.1 hypothetical protein FX988_00044 [Paraglaciecola mesophila]
MKNSVIQHAGLGASQARVNVYIGNRPTYQNFPVIDHRQALHDGDIEAINRECGNGWRKVFNVYAKLIFAWRSADARLNAQLAGAECQSWQAYRDRFLLQESSQTALIFPSLEINNQSVPVHIDPRHNGNEDVAVFHIIMGRTYAKSMLADMANTQALNLHWLDQEFAIDSKARAVVCPYFDYRQLSNIKIIRLVELLMSLDKAQA